MQAPFPFAAATLDPTLQPAGAQQVQEDAALYVGNLGSLVTDSILYQHFQPYGKIVSVVIKKHYVTGASRGFAFVNFASMEDAKRARDNLNHASILDREIRVCFKKDFKNLDPNANVFVKNLPETVRGKQLEEEFAAYGSIFSGMVKYDENGKSCGYGYVQYREADSADKAIQALDGNTVFGQIIKVMKFKSIGNRNIVSWKTNLYTKNFPKSWNTERVNKFIEEKFKPFGTLASVCVKFNEKMERCFAFIAFEKVDDATKAMNALNDSQVDGEALYVGYAQKKDKRRKELAESFAKQTNETNLFLKSLKETVTEEQLRKVFSAYGEVTSVAVQFSTKVPKSIEAQGAKLKFGFVNFAGDTNAKEAFIDAKKNPEIKDLISPYHDERKDFIYFAQPKSVREQYLRMVKKNLQSTTMLQTQMNMFRMMMEKLKKGAAPVRKGKGAQNQTPQMPLNMFGGAGMQMDPAMMSQFMGFDFSALARAQAAFPGAPVPSVNPIFNMAGLPQQNVLIPQGMPAPQQIIAPQQAVPTEARDLNWLTHNQKEFESLDPNEKRKILGNLMYYRVATQTVDKDLVPKITGMLIDLEVLDLTDVIEILTSEESLKTRVDDAIKVINETIEH